MRALIQRVSSANVSNENHETHFISHGLVVLLGVGPEDTTATAEKLMTKISKLRIFEDETGKSNRSIQDVQGSILLVSQFTLYADCRKGNRPSFTKGAKPDKAETLYHHCETFLGELGIPVETGWFGALMSVELTNEGPFTIWLDSVEL